MENLGALTSGRPPSLLSFHKPGLSVDKLVLHQPVRSFKVGAGIFLNQGV